MNERIRELAERTTNSIGWCIPSEDEQWIEKFAELIVRECMELLEDYTTDVHVGGIQYNVLSADETLQKHFGLE